MKKKESTYLAQRYENLSRRWAPGPKPKLAWVSQTAQTLKLPRKTFYDKLARHGLRAESFRKGGDDI